MAVAVAHLFRPYLRRVRRSGRIRRSDASRSTARPPRPEWVRDDLLERTGVDQERRQRAARTKRPAAPDQRAWSIRRDLVFARGQMNGMVWSERTCARAGLTFADPWSDRRIASFVLAVPPQVLNRPGRNDKRIVREAMRGIMPEPVRQASAKILPTPLFEHAMQQGAVQTVQELITGSQLASRGYVDEAVLQSAYADVRRGVRDASDLWSTLTVEMWLRRYWS